MHLIYRPNEKNGSLTTALINSARFMSDRSQWRLFPYLLPLSIDHSTVECEGPRLYASWESTGACLCMKISAQQPQLNSKSPRDPGIQRNSAFASRCGIRLFLDHKIDLTIKICPKYIYKIHALFFLQEIVIL